MLRHPRGFSWNHKTHLRSSFASLDQILQRLLQYFHVKIARTDLEAPRRRILQGILKNEGDQDVLSLRFWGSAQDAAQLLVKLHVTIHPATRLPDVTSSLLVSSPAHGQIRVRRGNGVCNDCKDMYQYVLHITRLIHKLLRNAEYSKCRHRCWTNWVDHGPFS